MVTTYRLHFRLLLLEEMQFVGEKYDEAHRPTFPATQYNTKWLRCQKTNTDSVRNIKTSELKVIGKSSLAKDLVVYG